MKIRKKKAIINSFLIFLILIGIGHYVLGFIFPAIEPSGRNSNPISGQAIFTNVKNQYNEAPTISRYILLGEWLIIIVIVIVILIKSQIKLKHDLRIGNFIKESRRIQFKKQKSETDLDLLYEMLKKRKVLNLSAVSKIFRTKKEVALEWFKLLEDSELGLIHYPLLGEPEITLMEEVKNEKRKKDKKKKQKDKKDK